MSEDNKDQYNKKRRKDDDYNVGESSPGTVGDSKGTGDKGKTVPGGRTQNHHDVNSIKEFVDNSTNSGSKKKTKSKDNSFNGFQYLKSRYSEGDVIEVEVDRMSSSGNPIAEINGADIHVDGAEPGEVIEAKIVDFRSGYIQAKKLVTE